MFGFGIAPLVGNLIGGVSVSFLGGARLFLIPLVTSGIALATFIGLDQNSARPFSSLACSGSVMRRGGGPTT